MYMRYHNSFFDLPSLHSLTDSGRKFIRSVQSNSDVEIYGSKAVQLLVQS